MLLGLGWYLLAVGISCGDLEVWWCWGLWRWGPWFSGLVWVGVIGSLRGFGLGLLLAGGDLGIAL